jgi:aspartyl-tRNA(Asn)/glutamyl-tRNA(Gln) amidotransferase subunit C
MKISKEEIEHIAVLARLHLTEEEKETFGLQLSSILGYMEKLEELDTEDVEPTSHVLSLRNVTREDAAVPSLPREEALVNSPAGSDEFYRVPKIIE